MAKKETSLESFNVKALKEIQGKEAEINEVIKNNPFIAISDNKTYEEGKKRRTALRTCRTSLEKEETSILDNVKKHITEPVKKIYSDFALIIDPAEKTQQEEVKRYEDLKEKEKQEKLRQEEERKNKLKQRIDFFFRHYSILINELKFENLPFKIGFEINKESYEPETFEDFQDVFEHKLESLNVLLENKTKSLNELENIRIENERLENERKENVRKEKIKASIDYYYTTWQDMFSNMQFEDIKELTDKFNSENALDCAEFQDEYAQKRANLVRMLEAKSNFLTQAENQRIQQEKLEEEKKQIQEEIFNQRKQKLEEIGFQYNTEHEKFYFENKYIIISKLKSTIVDFDHEFFNAFINGILEEISEAKKQYDLLEESVKNKPTIVDQQTANTIEVEAEVIQSIEENAFNYDEEKVALLKGFYNYCMENHNGMLREENIYLYLNTIS